MQNCLLEGILLCNMFYDLNQCKILSSNLDIYINYCMHHNNKLMQIYKLKIDKYHYFCRKKGEFSAADDIQDMKIRENI